MSQIPGGYYDAAINLSGEELKNALYEIIKGHTQFPLSATGTDVWDILKESDRDMSNHENVILMYSGWSVNAAQEYNSGKGWTRGKVWAKSHGDFGDTKGAGTDVHHIRPVDLSVNSARSNKDFDYGGNRYIDGDGETDCYSDVDSWEPRDAVKGDIARMLFYMATRYEGDNGEPDLELVDDVRTIELCEPGKGYHGRLSTLLEWHRADPVDSFEIRRNNIIFSFQNNRNPFIDHPEFADKIWSVTVADKILAPRIFVYPNPARQFIHLQSTDSSPAEGLLISAGGVVVREFTFAGTYTLETQNLIPGMYFIKIAVHNKCLTEKIIVGR